MRILRTQRRVRSAVNAIELLEQRQLLTATMLTAVPAQNLVAGAASTQINLGTYLNDPSITGGTVVEMQTPLGNIPLQLTDTQTPLTVTNFVRYINNGQYAPTILQRSVPGFVLQGGGTKPDGSNNVPVATLKGEPGISNTTGTIAMALSNGPDTGTNQWFINLANNNGTGSTPNLDTTADGGPFTAFGNVIDGGMTVVNAIANLNTIVDASAENGNWGSLPVINYHGSTTPSSVPQANLVTDNIVKLTAAQAAPTYSVVSANPAIVTATVTNGVLTLAAASSASSGSTTVTATVTDLSGATATSTFNVTVRTLPAVTISNASGAAATGGQVLFPVTLAAASSSPVTLNYSLTPGSAPSGDYQSTGSSLTIPVGTTTINIPVNIIADSSGAAETFTITLSGLSSNAIFSGGTTTETATGTITPVVPVTIATTTTLTASALAVVNGGPDTFIATVASVASAETPTGSVTFNVGGTAIGSAAVNGGIATLDTTLTSLGNLAVTAAYTGEDTFTSSTSNTVTVNVSSLTPTVAKSTLPTNIVTGAPTHGTLLLTATNNASAGQKGFAFFNVYASLNKVIDGNSVLLATVKRMINLKTGKSVTVPVPIKSLPASLAAGDYTLLTQTVDTTGNTSNASAGPTLNVAAPFISLSETFVKLSAPAAVVAGSKTSAVAVLRISNGGNIPAIGPTVFTLYASSDGTVGAGTLIRPTTRNLSIGVGRSVTVPIPLAAFPSVGDGNYFIVAQTLDPKGGISSAKFGTTVNIAAAKIDLANTVGTVPTTGKIGKSINVTLQLANNGNISAVGTLAIAFSVSTSSLGTSPITLETLSTHINLNARHTQALHLKVPLPAGTPTGNIYLVSTVDPLNVFGDLNLVDNTSVSSTSILLS